jgi:SAM-dependent methyltransferase
MDEIGQPLDALMGALGSLGDPTRLRLLRLLERRELGVADLVSALQLPQSTVSRHLKVLSDQGWVKNRAEGTNRIYRMPTPEETVARKLWHVAKDQTEEWATAKQDQLRLDQLESRRPQEALAFFAGAAGTWDRLRSELYGNSFNDSALLSLIPSDWTVADLGCGSGILAARIAPHVHKVIGIDQSTAMLKAAKKRTAAYKNVDLHPGSLEALPLADRSVDATLVVLALSYLKDTRLALAEMSRVLKPGGRAVVVDLLRHDREFGRKEIRLAEHEMPGLMAICAPRYGESSRSPARRSWAPAHDRADRGAHRDPRELGAEVRWVSCNIFSTQDHAAAASSSGPRDGTPEASPKGVPVFAWKGETLEEYWWCTVQALTGPTAPART